jgi:hypothetical protein
MAKSDYWKFQPGCKHLVTHGQSKTPTWRTWAGMRNRCNNPNNQKYPAYGGKGIKVCERWGSFENFVADMGERPSPKHSIDRIDNTGHYTPENCRWATPTEQANNKSTNRCVTFLGESLTVAEWSRRTGIPYFTLMYRIKAGWSAERALTEPVILGKNQAFSK